MAKKVSRPRKAKKKTVVDDEGGSTFGEPGEEPKKVPKRRTQSVCMNAEKPLVRRKTSMNKSVADDEKSKMGEATCMMQPEAQPRSGTNRKDTILDPEQDVRDLGSRDPENMTPRQKTHLQAFIKQYTTMGVRGLLEEFEAFKTYNITPFQTKHHGTNPSKNRYKDGLFSMAKKVSRPRKAKKKTVVDDEGGSTFGEPGEEPKKVPKRRTQSVCMNAEKPLVRRKTSMNKSVADDEKSKMGEATCMMQPEAQPRSGTNRKDTILDPEQDVRDLGSRDPENMTPRQKTHLQAFIKQYTTMGVRGLLEEFEAFKTYNITPFQTKHHGTNPSKNRYKDIFCIDVTRIKLQDGMNGDYIHANLVDKQPLVNKFVATQGPIEATVNDFWRMVVQENVGYIFMLCSVVELEKKKCEQYYPETEGQMMKFMDINVTLVSKTTDAHFVCSKFLLDAPGKPKRYIYHNQWKNWPDHGVPQTALAGLRMLKQARSTKFTTIVHCSAGVGRTGTLIAIEWLLQTICTKPPPYDMREMLKEMRNQRAHAIQTAPQYVYIAYSIFRLMAMKDPSAIPAFMKYSAEMAQVTGVKLDGAGATTGTAFSTAAAGAGPKP